MVSGSSSVPLSRAETLVGVEVINVDTNVSPELKKDSTSLATGISEKLASEVVTVQPTESKPKSVFRKYMLLVVFCLAQFLDVVNNSSIMAAIPTIASELGMSSSEEVWIVSATQLAFASFLLLSGRISDVYSAKLAFTTGISILAIISVIIGLIKNKIAMFALRAVSGAFASLTIPSALNLIVRVFPEPLEQSRAVAAFGASGTIGNILGLFIGAIIVQYASWSWVFWFTALVAAPVALIGAKLIPGDDDHEYEMKPKNIKMKGLDLIGVSMLTAALILFIYAITTGSSGQWAIPGVLVPMIIAVILFAGFFYYESVIPEESAALPPKTWSYPNFTVLTAISLLPYFWWTTLFLIFTNYWQDVFGWTAILSVIHQLPLSFAALAVTFTGPLSRIINPKWLISTGMIMTIVATTLLPFASTPQSYWPFVFPAFVIGSAGMQLIYTHTGIAIFRSTPPHMAGTVGAVFNSSLQLGSAVGSAAITSITSSIESKLGPNGSTTYVGKAASFWFLLAIVGLEAISCFVFYKPKRVEHQEEVDSAVPELPEQNYSPDKGNDEKV